MQKSITLKILILTLLAITFSLTSSALSDGGIDHSYYPEFDSAGLMSDSDEILVSPEDDICTADALRAVCYFHSANNSGNLKENASYEDVVSYAASFEIGDEDVYNNGDKPIFRSDFAQLVADSADTTYFEKINDVSSIPDVDINETYYNDVLMLYNAGIMRGCDKYGCFFANDFVSRDELSGVLNRVAVKENREYFSLESYGDRNPAVYLIEDEYMTRGVRKVNYIASGWSYENPILLSDEQKDYSSNVLTDISNEHAVTIRKEIRTVTTGPIVFHCDYLVTGCGSSVYFEDFDGNKLFEVFHDNNKLYAIGSNKVDTGYEFAAGIIKLSLFMDLDSREVGITVNGENLGFYSMTDVPDLSRVCIGTSVEQMTAVTVNRVIMYWNYDVHEDFRMSADGDELNGWKTEGDVAVVSMLSDSDSLSAGILGVGSAKKSFDSVIDKFVCEAYVRVEEGQNCTFTLYDGSDSVFSVNADSGVFACGDSFLRNFTQDVWQQVRIEVDTDADVAVVKINGKNCGSFDFPADSINALEISADGNGICNFDDVLVYNVYDYADYCPEPVPVNDDEWYSGMSVCSLWREGSHYGWDCISPYEDLTPVIGYYDEGIPEAMDWEIKFMVEHGYDYQRFCWYYGGYSEHIKKPRLCDDAIHDGYFNAKYSEMLDFSIMWENAGSKGSKEEFYNNIWPYWVDWYLTDDRYFCIDNKPVITIYSRSSFYSIMGTEQDVKDCIDFMENELIKLGYDGLILYVSDAAANSSTNQSLANVGFDSKTAYHFNEPAYDIDYQKIRMLAEHDAGNIHFTPSCGIGFNDIGWTETRSPLASAEDFEELLRWVRDDYLLYYENNGFNDWRSKSIMTNTWNEFGEGHYVFPTSLNKFGYMDAHRHVFSSVAGTDDSDHFDIVPTLNQKSRLGYLYTARRIPLRKLQYDDGLDIDSNTFVTVKKWDFENEMDCLLWTALAKTTVPLYDGEEKAFVGETTTNDGHIKMLYFEENFFSAEESVYLHVRMKVNTPGASHAELYFKNTEESEWSSTRGLNFSIISDGKYHDYYINLQNVANWQGDIVSLRFDPLNVAGPYYIKTIEFLKFNSEVGINVDVDGKVFNFIDGYYHVSDDEIYVAANPTNGFYSANLFYYEWNRWNGTMFIRTSNGHEFVFTVGSNTALVDGVLKSFDIPVSLCDGLVMLPLTFIYDNSDFSYRFSDNGDLAVEVKWDGIRDIMESRVPYEYEFNIPGDLEGWRITCANGGVANGNFAITSTFNGVRYDPQIGIAGLYIDSKLYNKICVKVRPTYYDTKSDSVCSIYFTTNSENAQSESKSVKIASGSLTADDEGYYTLNFDMSTNKYWTENITSLRFDPPNRYGYYEIDYIRLSVDEEYVKYCEERDKANQIFKENLMCADRGLPFFVVNPDGENDDVSFYNLSSNTVVSVVDDDLRDGNRAIMAKPLHNDSKVWTYLRIPTRFKPGTKYKVEFEYRLLGDINGADVVTTDFAVNFVYSDVDSDGLVKEKMDHSMAASPVSKVNVSDGWIKCSVTHTVSQKSPSRTNDCFSIYTSPQEKDGEIHNFCYLIDNIVVYVADNHYDFNTSGSTEGWKYAGSNGNVSQGNSVFTSVAQNSKYDPHMYIEKLSIDAEIFKKIKVRVKPEFYDSSTANDFAIYFATEANPNLDEVKTRRIQLSNVTADSDGFYTLTFDMSNNSLWDGTVTNLRFDPPNRNGKFTVDYIYVDVE